MGEAAAIRRAVNGARVTRRIGLAVRLSSWALVFSGYMALATVREIGAPVLLIPLLLLFIAPIGERLDRGWGAYRALTRAGTITYACFIPLTVIVLGLTGSVIALVIFIQIYIMVHLKEENDYLHLYLMAFFLLLAACVQTPEPSIALVMVMFLVSAIWAFLTLRLDVETRASRALTSPELLPIDALHPVAHRDGGSLFDAGLVGTVMALSMASLFFTAVVFFFVPRIEAGFFGHGEGETDVTGLDQTVDLTGDAFVQEDDTPVMYVRFPGLSEDEMPPTSDLYWRSTTLSLYGNSQWSRTGTRRYMEPRIIYPEAPELPNPGQFPPGGPPAGSLGQEGGFGGGGGGYGRGYGGGGGYGRGYGGGGGFGGYYPSNSDLYKVVFQNTSQEISRRSRKDTKLFHQIVYMPSVPEQGVPVLDLVQRMRVTKNAGNTSLRWDRYRDFSVLMKTTGARQLDFEAWSEEDTFKRSDLRNAPNSYPEAFAEMGMEYDYEILTNHDLLDSTQRLIQEVVSGDSGAYEQAVAIEQWLSSGEFEYTLELPSLPAQHAIDAFLGVEKRGHCELFASAMALAMRSLGVPTRVVSGYRGGELSEAGDSFIVRASMAHLWVEVWFPEFGWVKFDPSPMSRELKLSGFQNLSLMFSRYQLRAQMLWYREVVGFDSGLQIDRLKNFTFGFIQSFGSSANTPEVEDSSPPIMGNFPLGYIVLGILGVIAYATIRKLFRKRAPRIKCVLTDDQGRSVRLYKRLRRQLRRCGVTVNGGTAGELLDSAAGSVAPATLEPIIRIYNEVRFGLRPLTRDRYRELLSQIRLIRG